MDTKISPIYWLWIPVLAMALQAVLEITLPGDILSSMQSENGPHELLEFGIIAAAFVWCLTYFIHVKNKTPLLTFWFSLAALCCFYVAGEEISWGQQFLSWATPEYWLSVNDQQETNLHNTSSWFDQKPRLILELGIVVGTLILTPLYRRGKLKLREDLAFLLPPMKLGIIAALVVIPQLLEKFFELFDTAIFSRFSEVQELYMFYFVLLYVVLLKAKVLSR